MREELVNEQIAATYEGGTYLFIRQRDGQKMKNLEKAVKELIAENALTATQAKGFLEYMKIIVDGCSRLPKQK